MSWRHHQLRNMRSERSIAFILTPVASAVTDSCPKPGCVAMFAQSLQPAKLRASTSIHSCLSTYRHTQNIFGVVSKTRLLSRILSKAGVLDLVKESIAEQDGGSADIPDHKTTRTTAAPAACARLPWGPVGRHSAILAFFSCVHTKDFRVDVVVVGQVVSAVIAV